MRGFYWSISRVVRKVAVVVCLTLVASNATATPSFVPKTELPFRLVSVDPANSIAIIENILKNTQDIFSVADRVFDQSTLLKVEAEAVTLETNGKVEKLYLKGAIARTESDSNPDIYKAEHAYKIAARFYAPRARMVESAEKFNRVYKHYRSNGNIADYKEESYGTEENPVHVFSRQEALFFTKNIDKLVQTSKPRVVNEDGKVLGLQLTKVDNDSPIARSGLKSGDTIISANGEQVTSPSDIESVVRSLEADWLELEYLRNGSKKKLSITSL